MSSKPAEYNVDTATNAEEDVSGLFISPGVVIRPNDGRVEQMHSLDNNKFENIDLNADEQTRESPVKITPMNYDAQELDEDETLRGHARMRSEGAIESASPAVEVTGDVTALCINDENSASPDVEQPSIDSQIPGSFSKQIESSNTVTHRLAFIFCDQVTNDQEDRVELAEPARAEDLAYDILNGACSSTPTLDTGASNSLNSSNTDVTSVHIVEEDDFTLPELQYKPDMGITNAMSDTRGTRTQQGKSLPSIPSGRFTPLPPGILRQFVDHCVARCNALKTVRKSGARAKEREIQRIMANVLKEETEIAAALGMSLDLMSLC